VTPVLEIRDLSVDYGQGQGAVHAVSSVNLVLNRGEVLGLAGESGSGKSTLAYAMTRLLPPPGIITGGQVLHHGRDKPEAVDVLGLSPKQLRSFRWNDIAIVFQGAMNSLNPVSTVASQLEDIYRAHRPEMSRAQRNKRSAELLRLVGISADRLGAYPHQLSGGMRQRVMIAMALACRPKLLIADEPTTALDVTVQAQILELLAELQRELGMSVLLITHDLGVVAETARRAVVMYAGTVVERASVPSLFAKPRHPYTAGLFLSLPRLDRDVEELRPIEGAVPDPMALPSGCRFHPRCPLAMPICKERNPELNARVSSDGTPHVSACFFVDEQPDADLVALSLARGKA